MENLKEVRQKLIRDRERKIALYEAIKDESEQKENLNKEISNLTDKILGIEEKLDKKSKKFYN